MPTDERPLTAERVRALIGARARAASRGLGVPVNDLIQLAHRDRFLSRIFTDDEWVLKGGTGILARVPTGRSTIDVDLYRNGYTVQQSVDRLVELADVDLGDFFQFIYRSREAIGTGDNQPYVDGTRVVFDSYLGARPAGVIKIDLVSGVGATEPSIVGPPAFRLDIPELVTNDYHLYALADQIADKVCATVDTYRDAPSSRTKDGVDLVVIARTQRGITADALTRAVSQERKLRRLDEFDALVLPVEWATPYARIARQIPACAEHRTLDAAQPLISAFLDPILDGTARGTWDPDTLVWA